MKIEDIKSVDQMERFVEGCLNDFESGVSTKEETMSLLGDYTIHVIEVARKTKNLFE